MIPIFGCAQASAVRNAIMTNPFAVRLSLSAVGTVWSACSATSATAWRRSSGQTSSRTSRRRPSRTTTTVCFLFCSLAFCLVCVAWLPQPHLFVCLACFRFGVRMHVVCVSLTLLSCVSEWVLDRFHKAYLARLGSVPGGLDASHVSASPRWRVALSGPFKCWSLVLFPRANLAS